MQIVNLSVKLHLYTARSMPDDSLSKLMRYVLELARFDPNYDIRDRTRLMTACLGLASNNTGDSQVAFHADGAL
jgi:vesicle coat complex subunit